MYESILEHDDDLGPLLKTQHDPALFHCGSLTRLLRVHRRHVALVASGYHPELPPPGPYLMRRLADARTLRVAYDDLCRDGGSAPGPNHLCPGMLDHTEVWSLCRALAQAIRRGNYRPGPERKVRIPKRGKPGTRQLTIQILEDRTVGRAALLIFEPVVDPSFSPFSFGWRSQRQRLHALGTLLALARLQQAWTWLVDDVADAFDAIPHNRFLQVCGRHFPTDVVQFIRLISYTGKKRGLRQGSPVSPLFANLYFDHVLDRPWHRRHPQRPLLRTADDLLVACRDAAEAAERHRELSALALAAGTPLKGSTSSSIVCIREGQSATWLGFLLRREANRLAIRIGEPAWDHLAAALSEAHLGSMSPIRAGQAILGWLGQQGPSYVCEDRDAVLRRLKEMAAERGFEELPERSELMIQWRRAHTMWEKVQKRQAQLLPQRLEQIGASTNTNGAAG